jgi:palmitoyltransferase
MTRIVAAAVPSLTARSVGPLSSLNDPDKGVTPTESTNLIIKNWATLKEDLSILSKLLHIARNLLVTPEPEVPQDLCAAVHFDQMVYQVIILCVNVTSKGYDGEILDNGSRTKLNEITDGCMCFRYSYLLLGPYLLTSACRQEGACDVASACSQLDGEERP